MTLFGSCLVQSDYHDFKFTRLTAQMHSSQTDLERLSIFNEGISDSLSIEDEERLKGHVMRLFNELPNDLQSNLLEQIALLSSHPIENPVGRGRVILERDPFSYFVKRGIFNMKQMVRFARDNEIILNPLSSELNRIWALRDLLGVLPVRTQIEDRPMLSKERIKQAISIGLGTLSEETSERFAHITAPSHFTTPISQLRYKLDQCFLALAHEDPSV